MELLVKKTDKIQGVIKVPPSKSYTHRAIIISSLACGRSKLKDPLYSEDTLATQDACRAFGCDIEIMNAECMVQGMDGNLNTPSDVINVRNSGTTLRLMTSASALSPKFTVLTGDGSIRRRPMQPLLDSLQDLGVLAFSTKENGMPPVIIKGGFIGGSTNISGSLSSQFISSLLIASPYAENPVNVQVKGEFISQPYVEVTLDVMAKFGVEVEYGRSGRSFHIEPQSYKAREYAIEGDYSSASYLVAAAATLESEVRIKNLFPDSIQGDKQILDIVQDMGAQVVVEEDEIKIWGQGKLQGVEVNLKNAPDLLPTVAVLGALSSGTTIISGVEHARFKETDRIHTCALELSKLGVRVEEEEDGLKIRGGAHGGVVDSHGDHRMVMALSIVGLNVGDIKIRNASHYQVSFPNFPEIMREIGCRMELQ